MKVVLDIEIGKTEIVRTRGWEGAIKEMLRVLIGIDRRLWRKARKRPFQTENTIMKSRAELEAGDLGSWGMLKDVEQESGTNR